MLGLPLGALVVVLNHVDVLGLIGSQQDFGPRGGLLHVRSAHGNGCQVLFGLVHLAQAIVQFLLGHGTVVNHGVLHVLQALYEVDELGRLGVAQLLLAHDVGVLVAGTVHAIFVQAVEALFLVGLSIVAGLDEEVDQAVVGLLINLGVLHQILGEFQCLGHVLAQATQRQVGLVVSYNHRDVASQLVQALLELGSRHLLGSQVVHVAQREVIAVVGGVAEVILVGELEQVVQIVVLVEQRQLLAGLAHGHLLAVVHKLRLDGLDGLAQDVAHEVALLVAVGGDGGDGRLVNLLGGGVLAHALVHAHEVVVQVAVGKGHDLVLGHTGHAVEFAYLLGPVHVVDKGVDQLTGAGTVVVECAQVVQLVVVYHAHQQVIVKVAGTQFCQLAEHELAHFLEALALIGITQEHKHRVVGHHVAVSTAVHQLHGLVQVQVHQTGRAVGEHLGNDVNGIALQRVASTETPAQGHEFGFLAHDGGVDGGHNGLEGSKLGTGEVIVGLPASEVALQDGDDLVGVKVTSHTDGHIVGAVVVVEVVLDVSDRRVLQVLLCTDGRLGAIGVGGEHLGIHGLEQLPLVLGDADVVLLIHGLQLGVETTDDHVLETVGLDACPAVHLVGGDVLGITGHVGAGIGVSALTADAGHQLVILVGDVVLCS